MLSGFDAQGLIEFGWDFARVDRGLLPHPGKPGAQPNGDDSMSEAGGFNLSEADVAKLLTDNTIETRAMTARKVAGGFSVESMTPKSRALAEDIFRLMVKDAEVLVRKALSDGLAKNADIPKDVAVNLAQDVAEVSLPVIEFSEVLDDNDLLDIIRNQGTEQQIAVAKRATVSESISDALVDTANEDVVATLVGNDGAEISENTMHRVVDDFGHLEKVQEPLVKRKELPISVAERMVTIVSERLQDYLVTHHEVSPDIATDLIMQTREKTTVNMLAGAGKQDVQRLVDQLYLNGRLTPSIILRALCTGDLLFFEAAMARLANVPVPNAYILINDRGGRGFGSLYKASGLAPAEFPIYQAAVDCAREMEYDGGNYDRERFAERMIERVLTYFETGGVDDETASYLLKKLEKLDIAIHSDQAAAS